MKGVDVFQSRGEKLSIKTNQLGKTIFKNKFDKFSFLSSIYNPKVIVLFWSAITFDNFEHDPITKDCPHKPIKAEKVPPGSSVSTQI